MTEGRRQRWILTAILSAVALGGGIDLWLDRPQAPGLLHVVFEGTLLAGSLVAMAWLWAGWMRTRRSLAGARADSEAHRSERDAWRARAEKLLRGLGDEMLLPTQVEASRASVPSMTLKP